MILLVNASTDANGVLALPASAHAPGLVGKQYSGGAANSLASLCGSHGTAPMQETNRRPAMFAAAHRTLPRSPVEQSPTITKQCAAFSCRGAGILTRRNFRRTEPDLWSHNTRAQAWPRASLVDERCFDGHFNNPQGAEFSFCPSGGCCAFRPLVAVLVNSGTDEKRVSRGLMEPLAARAQRCLYTSTIRPAGQFISLTWGRVGGGARSAGSSGCSAGERLPSPRPCASITHALNARRPQQRATQSGRFEASGASTPSTL